MVDLLAGVIEDRRLHRAVEELVGMAAEELVERVLAGDVDREPPAAPPRPPPHLLERGDGAGEGDDDRGVEGADVDAELERARGDDGEQLAFGELALELVTLLGGVARAVGGDALGELRLAAAVQVLPRGAGDDLGALAGADEADGARTGPDEVGQQLSGL